MPKSKLNIIAILILSSLISGLCLSADNSATRGSYATDFPSYRIAVGANAYDQNKKQVPAFWARITGALMSAHGHSDYIYANGWYFYEMQLSNKDHIFHSLEIYCSQLLKTWKIPSQYHP